MALSPGRRTIGLVRRVGAFVVLLLVASAAVGVVAPPASPPPARLAAGVIVSGVAVGGLTPERARARIRAAVARPLRFRFGARSWKATPEQLQVSFAVDEAVTAALAAAPGERLSLESRVIEARVSRYVGFLAHTFNRRPVSSRLVGLIAERPLITRSKAGLAVRRQAMVEAIASAMSAGSRRPITLAVRVLRPTVDRADFGSIVVINRGTNTLRLYRGVRQMHSFRIATGSARYPTPTGTFRIVDMQRYPWWYPPPSDWARGLKPVPPGPGNPLGTRWMGLSAGNVGIHGTPDAASVGYSASHGCIRMYLSEATWLFDRVRVGTPVYIV